VAAANKKYFIRTSSDGAEKGPYTLEQIKDSLANDRIQDSAIARPADDDTGKRETTAGELVARFKLEQEKSDQRAAAHLEARANRPAPWRIVPLIALIGIGLYQSYDAYQDWRFLSAASSLGLSGGGAPTPMRLVLWLGITFLAGLGAFRFWKAYSATPE